MLINNKLKHSNHILKRIVKKNKCKIKIKISINIKAK